MIGALRAGRLRRHRRLLVLCGLSALVHLALLEWLAGAAGGPALPRQGQAASEDLVLRLAPPRRAPANPPPRARVATEPQTAAQPRARPRPQAGAAAPPATAAQSAPPSSIPPSAAPPASAPPAGQALADAADDGAEPLQMPGRYRVRMPDAVVLSYTHTRQATAGAPPQRLPDARINWRSDGERYVLTVDGVLGHLASQGGSGDAGVRPRRAVDEGAGAAAVIEFADGEVRFGADGRSVPDSTGIQDRASLLMQLAGIGLGEPDQVQAGGTLDVVVAGADDITVERFLVLGTETLATPLGAVEAWHLAQRAAPGLARLEVWLAPARGWLPVQLRLGGAGGIATQTIRTIAPQPLPPH